MTAIDWRTCSKPWREIGPVFAREARAIAAGELPLAPPPPAYPCALCDFIGKSGSSLGGHIVTHHRPTQR